MQTGASSGTELIRAKKLVKAEDYICRLERTYRSTSFIFQRATFLDEITKSGVGHLTNGWVMLDEQLGFSNLFEIAEKLKAEGWEVTLCGLETQNRIENSKGCGL